MLTRDSRPPAVIAKYYIYQATTTFGFFWPVFTIYLLDRGLTFTEIGLLGSLSAAFVVVGEVPAGYVGDRVGRRNSLVVGAVLLAASVLGFAIVDSFVAFAGLWTLWALGSTFRSGSGDAWLYETLQERLDEASYTRVRGRGGAINQAASAATMLTAGGLYAVDPRLPFLAGGVLLAVSIPVLLSMPETADAGETSDQGSCEGDEGDGEFRLVDALSVLRQTLSTPPLRSTVLYLAAFYGVVNAADEFVQPIATGAVGLPEAGLGPLYAGFTVVAAGASYVAGDLEEYLSTRGALLVVPVFVGAFFLVPLAVPVAALPAFFLFKSARAAITPIATGYINEHADSSGRATVLSAAAMAYALARLPLNPAAGVVADSTTPLVALAALGALLLAAAVVVYAWEPPGGDAGGAADPGVTD